jgi:hypothetical protein
MLARQALYHVSHSASLDGALLIFSPLAGLEL